MRRTMSSISGSTIDDVGDRIVLGHAADQGFGRGGAPVEAQHDGRRLAVFDLDAGQSEIGLGILQVHDQRAVRAVFIAQALELAVVDDGALVDQHDAPAEPFDVGEIVRRENDGGAQPLVDVGDERADRFLGHDVEADRRFVEVDDLRIVQQRGREIAAHALAERELAHRRRHEAVEIEDLDEVREVRAVAVARHPVDRAQQFERLAQRQVPIELAALAEDDADVAGVLPALLVRYDPGDLDRAGSRHEDPGEHLDRGRLAGPVGTDVADQFARLDGHVDVLDRHFFLVLTGKEGPDRPAESFAADYRPERFPKRPRLNDWHQGSFPWRVEASRRVVSLFVAGVFSSEEVPVARRRTHGRELSFFERGLRRHLFPGGGEVSWPLRKKQ